MIACWRLRVEYWHNEMHTHTHTCTFTRVKPSVLIVAWLPTNNSATNIILFCTGLQTFCAKGPQLLLQHGSWAAQGQIAISGVPKCLNFCVTYSKYSTSFTKQSKAAFGLSLKLCLLFIYALRLYLLHHSVEYLNTPVICIEWSNLHQM
jgi:hypothetical protein